MVEETLLKERYARLLEEERVALSRIHEIASALDKGAEITERARSILEHLDELFLLVVVGEVKSGKSAFINALVGERICPEGPIPLTDRINILHYGPERRERLKAEFTLERAFPLDILRNMSIVDTPGTNSIVRRHQEITEDFIPKADMILFATSIDRPYTETEHQFLSYIAQQWRKKIVVILTKVDMHPEEDVGLVTEYIRENAKTKLGIEPLIFPVSAKRGVEARGASDGAGYEASGMAAVERYIREQLTDLEKLKLKLTSPLESALSVIVVLKESLKDRAALLERDFQVLNRLDAQVSMSCQELKERCYKTITEMYDLLREFELRGQNFLEEKISLSSFNAIRDAERFNQLFEKEVVADLKDRVDEAMHKGVDWLMRENISLYEKSAKFLNEQVDTSRYKDQVMGREETAFDYNREQIFGAIKEGFRKHVRDFDIRGESNRMVNSAYRGLLGFLGVELGAVALGTLTAALFSAIWLDVTGFLLAGAVALTGFFILPAKKRKAIREFRTKVDSLITQFRRTLTKEFDQEIQGSLENIRSSYKPYITFYKAETTRIDERAAALKETESALLALRNEIDRIGN